MKNLFISLLFLISLDIYSQIPHPDEEQSRMLTGTLYDEFVEGIAHRRGYYKLKRRLRRASDDHLQKLDAQVKEYIQDLLFTKQFHKAERKTLELKSALAALTLKINGIFESTDEYFLTNANKLDYIDATIAEKTALIEEVKASISKKVNNVIKKYPTIIT